MEQVWSLLLLREDVQRTAPQLAFVTTAFLGTCAKLRECTAHENIWIYPILLATLQEGNMQYVAMSRKVQVSVDNHLQLLGEDDFHTCKAVTWDKPSKEDLEGTATKWIQYCIDLTGAVPQGQHSN